MEEEKYTTNGLHGDRMPQFKTSPACLPSDPGHESGTELVPTPLSANSSYIILRLHRLMLGDQNEWFRFL